MADILIIDDDVPVCNAFSAALRQAGHDVLAVHTLREGMERIERGSFAVVLLDVMLPDGNGLEAVREITAGFEPPEVIILTGLGTQDGPAKAIESGAWDYLEKPPSFAQLNLSVSRALQYREQKYAHRHAIALDRCGIVGSGKRIHECLDRVAHAAESDANVLITGETGTGKELFARAIHANSRRSQREMVVVDCAALPETLVEDILFGHEKGAFSGAERSRVGLVAEAHGSTLFLDEIGELPAETQKKFLRVLQERTFRPLGGGADVKSDFRLICATNRHPEAMVEAGAFREDLFFRIRTIPIVLPPLRERKEDIREIAVAQLTALCDRYGMPPKGFSADFFEILTSYDWPGNVRELHQSLEHALINARFEPVLFPAHLPNAIRIHAIMAARADHTPQVPPALEGISLPEPDAPPLTWQEFRSRYVSALERAYLTRLLSGAEGNVREAASVAGLGLSRFYELLKKHGIPSK